MVGLWLKCLEGLATVSYFRVGSSNSTKLHLQPFRYPAAKFEGKRPRASLLESGEVDEVSGVRFPVDPQLPLEIFQELVFHDPQLLNR